MMGFFKSLKGDHPDTVGNSTSPSNRRNTSNLRNDSNPSLESKRCQPPPGPLPRHLDYYAAPPGPPPGGDEYAPPPGPPPGREEYIPPEEPLPSSEDNPIDPPPYHDWTSIPDNALLPPPPQLRNETSPSGNANRTDADRAYDWCKHHPLSKPHQPTLAQIASVRNGDVRLLKPSEFNGTLTMPGTGAWKGSTRAGSKDACLISSTPLYFASNDSPLNTEITKVIYYEVKVHVLGRGRGTDESSLALGYCGMPYPTWRMPGWQRGSLAVHGDDGRRYVNDTWGGKDFTSPFKVGDTVGLGVSFSLDNDKSPSAGTGVKVKIFFTRNGREEGEWNLHEELDAENDLGVEGLDGQFDLYGSLGIFGSVEFEISFNSHDWLWQPE